MILQVAWLFWLLANVTFTNGNDINMKSDKSKKIVLATDPTCADDVKKYCHGDVNNNLFVLECLANDLEDNEKISEACQHTIWSYKRVLTKDKKFEVTGKEVCKKDLEAIDECSEEGIKQGHVIPCLIEHYEEINETLCKDFLEKIEPIVFSDYRLVFKFVENCANDINDNKCGRLSDENDPLPHDQGKTITCLMENDKNLSPNCKKEIFHIAELQGGDFRRDRQLYQACKKDREQFCHNVVAGGGRVLRCLYSHKFHKDMSENCREKLTLRQRLEQEDFKVNYGLSRACKVDINQNHCFVDQKGNGLEIQMSVILLCLENAIKKNKHVSRECVAEMRKTRRDLMEDYRISPEIIIGCHEEMNSHCDQERKGKTLHCLLNLLKEDANKREGEKHLIGNMCERSLERLMKEVAVVDDPEIDPVLADACISTIKLQCADTPSDKILDCLFDLIGKKMNKERLITEDCQEKLMEIDYFVTRDFTISTKFMKSCYVDLTKTCGMPQKISDIKQEDQSIYISCLYRNRKNISPGCSTELKILLLERAKSMNLNPDVQMKCMADISTYCSERRNDELDCLEEHLEELDDSCKNVVTTVIEMEDETPELTKIFIQSCQPFWKVHCKDKDETSKENNDVLDADDVEEGEALMKCLIRNKNHKEMPNKCKAGVEHHQIIMLKDYSLSNEFKAACDEEVRTHCSDKKKKADVINCLSVHVFNDTMTDAIDIRIAAKCRKHLKFELLQRSENIKLDPELYDLCKTDIKNHCSEEEKAGSTAVIKCLRQPDHRTKLSANCHAKLFERDRGLAEHEQTDFELMTKCKRMIKKNCLDELQSGNVLACLSNYKEEPNFDKACFVVVIERLRRRAQDVRLNPQLQKSCTSDITKFCKEEIMQAQKSKVEIEGIVLTCLRNVFASKIKGRLTPRCNEHITSLVKESAMDYVQDRRLAIQCKNQIQQYCTSEVFNDRDDLGSKSNVEECLKKQMISGGITVGKDKLCWEELIRVISENKVDIHVDPILSRACMVELIKYCKDVNQGEGRKMSCMVEVYQNNLMAEGSCKKLLKERMDLWSKSVKLPAPENLSEAFDQLSSSPAKNYFLIIALSLLAIIFIWGIFCGRVTKRVARQMKNR